MALQNAEITVQFTAQWTGDHRVCYRVVGDPTYICTIPGSPSGDPGIHTYCAAGNTCQYNIPIQVDNETCDQVDYEGYVQAVCEDEASETGRIPFVISFIPDPSCKKYTYTCETVGIDTVDVVGGGDYNTPGLGPISVNAVSGGAVFDVTFDNTVNGAITLITVTTPGSYASGDLPPVLDWVAAGITENIESNLTFNLLNCAALEQSGCSGVNQTIAAGLALDESVELCNTGTPVTPPEGYAAPVENGNCLCNCTEYTVTETAAGGDDLTVNYIDCDGVAVLTTVVSGGSLGPICMATDSLVVTPIGGAVADITTGAACDAVAP